MDLKNLLNKEQYEAVITIDGPLLVLAGAGSGKTRVLTHRVAHMIKDLNIYPSKILAITFTNKAAGEMKDRIRELVGDEVEGMWISTFHSSCVRILRREIDKLGYNKNFAIYDSYDQKVLVKQCMKELNINDKDITDREIINKIGAQKDVLVSPEQFKRQNEGNFRMNKIADVYLLYQKKLKDNNALDFDDLIYKTVELFKDHSDVLEFYQRKFKYIMVDEYQDTNRSQYEFVRLLAQGHKNICVVGDDDQCIYAWRGADVRNILDFEQDYPNAKVIKLEQNYRSKGNILKAANDVISNNSNRKKKVLRTESENGGKIKLYRAYSDMDEGRYVAFKIKETLEKSPQRQYRDFAVLYRTNAQSRIFEDAFMKANIPYRIIGGLKFYDRKEIKDIMAYLKFINNPLDDVSLRRIINVPKRNIGDSTVQKIQSFAASMEESLYNVILDADEVMNLSKRSINSIKKFVSIINSFIKSRDKIPVSNLIREILDITGYLDELKDSKEADSISRVENLKELVSAASEFESTSEDTSLSAFLEKVTLVSDIDNFDDNADSVVLMTVHSAKGLEFPVVFMVGMENGIFPGIQSLDDSKEMEESRRLCYVGITRAKEQLYMTSAESRRVFGRVVAYEQSNFIDEISSGLKEYDTVKKNNVSSFSDSILNKNTFSWTKKVVSHTLSNEVKASPVNDISNDKYLKPEAIKEGIKVRHSKFGVGTIVSISKNGNDIKLTIVFDKMGIKNLMYGIVPLEAV
ncbi:DNA helicase PcrA [Clostridium luticellarii]|jgi:DNA helicase-2/ATP-dependent DNA helicase PcrA|uniref:ATP-dependent DNA helicase n=1 Tax=Clostridium luticellarii TaxID=1691940 RepID=A0A2T0BSU1_9CLOT|nr:DNA helicase PcrA [Clostridium luticellarii]MCI1945610.1 DNA helicase PcrA [Clostridium luticellarii]MCI1969396.1 DNA helicase PcrA [Clostridium luticellarii]MCI1996456.1 DNA helicase PcrA [Clostridium luticellarii]MCI2040809.1 DNA helicase PcrA [Clostridium luticellarii]PRR86912.1 ATP-dependent DNA helicase PcrA [Clostridium luticellarii]